MPGPFAVLNGQVNILPPRQAMAAIGKYFTVTNPTPGTAIAYALQTTFSATANGLFGIQNKNPAGGANIILDYLALTQTATAPATTSVMRFEVFNETGIVVQTGNVAPRTPVQPNQTYVQASTNAAIQSFAAGAATVPAAVGVRVQQSLGEINCGVMVVQDTYVLQFGGQDLPVGGPLTAARATDPARIVGSADVVVVAPQTTSWINLWMPGAATNIPSFEFSLTYYEI